MSMMPPDLPRLARIIDIISRIHNQPRRWTRQRLAGHYEISERMINQDLSVIRDDLNFSLRSARGLGYYFESIPQLPAVSYSLPEAVALVLAAQSARQVGGISQQNLAAAIARLNSVIPKEIRGLFERLETTAPSTPEDERQQDLLMAVSQAISMQRRLWISYAAASHGGTETERTIDPYVTVPYDRSWHVIGYCHLREDIRIFKIDRIQEAKILPESFERNEAFDLDAYLNEGWGLMRGLDGPIEEVVLKIQPPAAKWIAEDTWHPSQQLSWRSDGSLIFRVKIQITPEFQRWVFRWGRDAEIIQPTHLRSWVAEEAQAVLNQACK